MLAAAVLLNVEIAVRSAEPSRARLAIGTFSSPAEAETLTQLTSSLPDLLNAELSKSGDYELVERTQLDAALTELHLSASGGFVTTNVLHLGQLLSADWLVSGSLVVSDTATNLWTKVIDMRQGIVVAVEAVPCVNVEAAPVAKAAATFVIGATLRREPHQFIGVGTFQDLSLPSRELGQDWGRRLQTLVEGHFQKKGIGMVERENLTPLLDELRLRDGGFTAASRGDLKVQPAFWLLDGGFKWYRDTTDKLSVALRIERVGYREHISRFTVATPDEMGPHIVKLIEEFLDAPNPRPLAATPQEEAAIHVARGKDLLDQPQLRSGTHLRTASTLAERDKILRADAERKAAAVREFESALLLNPRDMEAKYRLGLALLMQENPTNQRAMDVLTEAAAGDSKEWAAQATELLQATRRLEAANRAPAVIHLSPAPVTKKRTDPAVTVNSETIAEFDSDIVVTPDATSFWIGDGNRVLQFNKRTSSVSEIQPPIPLHSPITCLAVRDNSIWLATDEDGVLQMTKSGGQYRLWTVRDGLLCPGIIAMFPEGDKLWLGFAYKNNGGLGYIDLKSQKFVAAMSPVWLFKTPEEHAQSALEAPVSVILPNGSRSLWIGTWGGLQVFHPATSTWSTSLRKPISSVAVTSNRVAVSTHANTVSILDLTSNNWSGDVDLSICFKLPLPAIVAWDADALWIGGGADKKLAIYDPKTKQFPHSVGFTGSWPRWLEFDETHAWIVTRRPRMSGSLLERVEKPAARFADSSQTAPIQPH